MSIQLKISLSFHHFITSYLSHNLMEFCVTELYTSVSVFSLALSSDRGGGLLQRGFLINGRGISLPVPAKNAALRVHHQSVVSCASMR